MFRLLALASVLLMFGVEGYEGYQQSYKWGEWSAWRKCSSKCGAGKRNRRRECLSAKCKPRSIRDSQDCEDYTGKDCNSYGSNNNYGGSNNNYGSNNSGYGSWNSWSKCTATCGNGSMKRSRSCAYGAYCGGALDESKKCTYYGGCKWGGWGAWNKCDAKCGDGKMSRSRVCPYGSYCGDSGASSISKPCTYYGSCYWGSWGTWSKCDAHCGSGKMKRARACPHGSYCGKDGRNEVQDGKCTYYGSCSWRGWGAWGDCTTKCGKGSKTRSRTCPFGAYCGNNDRLQHHHDSCDNYGGCSWGTWGAWGGCSSKCGKGTMVRARKCPHGAHCGKDYGLDEHAEACNYYGGCSWHEWGAWGNCNTNCGKGSMSRTRVCPHGAYCGKTGPNDRQDGSCAYYGGCHWGGWGAWGGCSAKCGKGSKHRSRPCPYGSLCGNDSSQSGDCEYYGSCAWGTWGAWSKCDAHCGSGKMKRARACPYGSYCGKDGAHEHQDGKCTYYGSCSWRGWGAWGDCTTKCGKGSKTRSRTCPFGAYCGNNDRLQHHHDSCDNYGGCSWGSWGAWGGCSANCGSGYASRKRKCPYGSYCGKSNGDDSSNHACASYGGCSWGEWGAWGGCSAKCGAGSMVRARKCPHGAYCGTDYGHENHSEKCSYYGGCSWGSWGAWSKCGAKCGYGLMKRARACPHGSYCGKDGAHEHQDGSCSYYGSCSWGLWGAWGGCSAKCGKGSKNRNRACPHGAYCGKDGRSEAHSDSCDSYGGCSWGAWGAWGGCSAKCGAGSMVRARKCPHGAYCGTDYGHENHSAACSYYGGCSWGSWGAWSKCDTHCGSGKMKRARACPYGSYCGKDGAQEHQDGKCTYYGSCSWRGWGAWGDCTTKCGKGSKTRSRTCPFGAYCGGNGRLEHHHDSCDNYGGCSWGTWGAWGSCSANCGKGYASRKRKCPYGSYCGKSNGDDSSNHACSSYGGCSWGEWGAWGGCSANCGKGYASRKRKCPYGSYCGKSTGEESSNHACDSYGGCSWGAWGLWSKCGAKCGYGKIHRNRKCGADGYCHGGSHADESSCSYYGGCSWGAWGNWGSCSSNCGYGKTSRQRKCPEGGTCYGGDNQDGSCTSLYGCLWSTWKDWGACSHGCGKGSKSRSRACSYVGFCGKQVSQQGECYGKYGCGSWNGWGAWSGCKTNCGDDGKRSRRRSCKVAGTCGKAGDSFEHKCSHYSGCKWGSWGEWASCSSNCGAGKRSRRRSCPYGSHCGKVGEYSYGDCQGYDCGYGSNREYGTNNNYGNYGQDGYHGDNGGSNGGSNAGAYGSGSGSRPSNYDNNGY